MSRKFELFMLHVGAGTNEKLAILSDSEYRAHISGILAVAATAPVRGRLLVGEMEAEAVQIAKKAGVTPAVAQSAMEKMQKVGVLYRDEDLDCWAVHDWEKLNPEPKRDATAAERARRYRERRKAQRHGVVTPPVTVSSRRDDRDGHAGITPPVTTPEVEGEEETADAVSSPAVPALDADVLRLCQLQSDLARSRTDEPPTSRKLRPTRTWHQEMERLIRIDGREPSSVENAIRWVDQHHFWRKVVLSVPTLREKFPQLIADAKSEGVTKPRPTDDKNAARRERTRERLSSLMQPTEEAIEGTVTSAAA